MFTGTDVPVRHFADDVHWLLAKGTDARDIITLVNDLKNEVQTLKMRCNTLEKAVEDLQSICDTHQTSLESFRQEIVKMQYNQGTLDLSYEGEELELMQS